MILEASFKHLNSLLFKSTINSTRTFKMHVNACQKQNLKVFVTQPIPNEALQILQASNLDVSINTNIPLKREVLLKGVKDVDALFCTLNEKIDKDLLDAAGSSLKVYFQRNQ